MRIYAYTETGWKRTNKCKLYRFWRKNQVTIKQGFSEWFSDMKRQYLIKVVDEYGFIEIPYEKLWWQKS